MGPVLASLQNDLFFLVHQIEIFILMISEFSAANYYPDE